MIAISIFSGLLIIMVYSFLFSLDAFMKAYVSSKTQETLRNVDQSISTSINLGTNGVVYLKPVQYNISNGNYTITSQGFCIGQYRYSYILSQESDSKGNYNYVNLSIPADILVYNVTLPDVSRAWQSLKLTVHGADCPAGRNGLIRKVVPWSNEAEFYLTNQSSTVQLHIPKSPMDSEYDSTQLQLLNFHQCQYDIK